VRSIRHMLENKIWLNPYSNIIEIAVHENLTGWLIKTENDKTKMNETN